MEDYEKKYKEALARAIERYEMMPLYDLEYCFPEIKPTQDEVVRRQIVDFIKWEFEQGSFARGDDQKAPSWLEWLDKHKQEFVPKDDTIQEASEEFIKGFNAGRKYVLDFPAQFNLAKKSNWTENDTIMLKWAIDWLCVFIKRAATDDAKVEAMQAVEWLKNLQPRKWSEEDEKMCDEVSASIRELWKNATVEQLQDIYSKNLDWLDSLENRHTWAPTNEEMMALLHAIGEFKGEFAHEDADRLNKLYRNLQALREYGRNN